MIAGSYEVGGPRGHGLLKINGMRMMHYLLSYGYYAIYYDVCYDMGGVEF